MLDVKICVEAFDAIVNVITFEVLIDIVVFDAFVIGAIVVVLLTCIAVVIELLF